MSSTTTTAARKPPAGVASNPNRRSFIQANSAARAASTTPPPQSTSPAPGHVRRHTLLDSSTRSRGSSIASARGVVGKRSGLSEQQEAENAAMLEELRNEAKELRARLDRSEGTAMEYQRQMEALQFRLDETSNEQAKIEDAFHQKQKEFEQLDEKMRKLNLAIRDRENAFEAERTKLEKDAEETELHMKELAATNQRLKDALAQRVREKSASDAESSTRSIKSRRASQESQLPPPVERVEPESFAPALPVVPQSDLLLQKDKLIESLRLELADTQVRLSQSEAQRVEKITEIEKQLEHFKSENARLAEEGESFQLLLQQATLNGDFSRVGLLETSNFSDTASFRSRSPSPQPNFGSMRRKSLGMGNLAEELEEADNRVSDEKYRKLESDYKELKDQNKALSLYINSIIERLLNHKDFEAILDKTTKNPTPNPTKPAPAARLTSTKALPPTPADSEPSTPTAEANPALSRTASIASRRQSRIIPVNPNPTGPRQFNPQPLQRSATTNMRPHGHTRSRSEIYPSSPPPFSPGLRSSRQSTFSPTQSDFSRGRQPSSINTNRNSLASTASSISDQDQLSLNSAGTSPPRNSILMGREPGQIQGGKALRPLRLVQQEDEEKKKKRGSWMGFGWLNGGQMQKKEETGEVVFERRDVE